MTRRYANWRAWFKPEVTEQLELLSAQEARIVSSWGMTWEAWNALTDAERAEKRFNFTKAPGFLV
jgi:hypothetical protein